MTKQGQLHVNISRQGSNAKSTLNQILNLLLHMFQSVTRRGENAALFIILEYIFKQLNESL